MQFSLKKTDKRTRARRGEIQLGRGTIQTPVFMPVGTQATVKAMTSEELESLGAEIILGNTYHLLLKPGHKTIQKLGGLHRFMHWNRPILTDSGGYQIFSLSQTRKMSEEGALFTSPIDGGEPHLLSPELAIEIQEALGSDIMMVLDECLPFPATEKEARDSMELSLKWAKRSLEARHSDNALFGIIQGGMYSHLRREYIERVCEIRSSSHSDGSALQPFNAYSIGGLSVGEPISQMYEITEHCAETMPTDKPRYLMGVGTPQNLVTCVGLGIDMFDCIMPTRAARHGTIYTSSGTINIKNSQYKEDPEPLDANCSCTTCQHYSRAYLRHLSMAKEILSARLCTLHNLHYYLNLMRQMRQAIEEDRFTEFQKDFLNRTEDLF